MRDTAISPTAAGGWARSAAMIPAISLTSLTRTEIWSLAKAPNVSRNSCSRSATVRP